MPFESLLVATSALLAVLGLVWVMQLALRRGWLPMANQMQAQGYDGAAVVHVLRLDARRRLHTVRCADRNVLILTGGPQDVVVGWLPGDPR
jgi:flagellar protein FliO/FliZ